MDMLYWNADKTPVSRGVSCQRSMVWNGSEAGLVTMCRGKASTHHRKWNSSLRNFRRRCAPRSSISSVHLTTLPCMSFQPALKLTVLWGSTAPPGVTRLTLFSQPRWMLACGEVPAGIHPDVKNTHDQDAVWTSRGRPVIKSPLLKRAKIQLCLFGVPRAGTIGPYIDKISPCLMGKGVGHRDLREDRNSSKSKFSTTPLASPSASALRRTEYSASLSSRSRSPARMTSLTDWYLPESTCSRVKLMK